jgi:hypothetical protein
LSQTVEQIVEFMGQCKGEKSVENGGKLVKNRNGKPATDMHIFGENSPRTRFRQ